MKSYICIVEGKVTGDKVMGVTFQSWAKTVADELGLKGWIRNVADGKAEILLQGSAENYTVFRERLRTEAPVPDLKNVTCNAMDYDKDHDRFEARG